MDFFCYVVDPFDCDAASESSFAPGGAWRYCSEDDFTPAAPPSPPSLPTPEACACSEPETGCVSGDADVSSRCGCGTFGVSDTPFCVSRSQPLWTLAPCDS